MKKLIKVLLLCVLMIPLHSFSQCGFTFLDVNISGCDQADNSFEIMGSVEFQNPPATGQLIIEDCNGNQQTFNAPFTSPKNYTLSGIDSDGTTGCDITAYFTDETACTITSASFDYPQSCLCTADVGTFSESINGMSTSTEPYLLCFGDELDIIGNGDFVPSQDFSFPGITYDPGVFLFVYECLPTVFNPNDLNTDSCLVGIASSNDQAWTIVNNVGDNSTLWFVPVTMYSMVDITYAVSINGGDWCFDMGSAYEVTFLEEYESSINPIVNDTLCTVDGPILLTATDTSGTWSSSCGACLDSNGVFNTGVANIGANTIYYSVGDSVCAVQDSLTVFVEECAGITENKKEEVSIYPNPASTSVTISAETLIEAIKIIDLNGRVHDNFTLIKEPKLKVELGEYTKGIYMVEVTTKTRVLVKKIIVE